MMNFKGPGIPIPKVLGKGGKGGCDEEDRTRDWYCSKCRERNFAKRQECFKCKFPKPTDGDCTAPPPPSIPPSGTTCNGMVKTYNRKGFGFLMILGMQGCQDIYYSRENLSSRLQTRDIPGQHVTFEIHRTSEGKLTALGIRPIGEEPDHVIAAKGKAAGKGLGFPKGGGGGIRDEEDRTRDWLCAWLCVCGERNFVKRFECYKCKAPRSSGTSCAATSAAAPAPQRTLSPHAGSRAVRDMLASRGGAGSGSSRSRSRGRKKKKRKRKKRRGRSSSSNSDDSSDSSSDDRAKKGRRRRSRSRGGSGKSRSKGRASVASRSKSSDCKMERPPAAATALKTNASGNPDVERAKVEAMEQLMKLRSLEPKEARMTEFRALLRKWHPDKNPERVELATTVFQFLQKGKPILAAD